MVSSFASALKASARKVRIRPTQARLSWPPIIRQPSASPHRDIRWTCQEGEGQEGRKEKGHLDKAVRRRANGIRTHGWMLCRRLANCWPRVSLSIPVCLAPFGQMRSVEYTFQQALREFNVLTFTWKTPFAFNFLKSAGTRSDCWPDLTRLRTLTDILLLHADAVYASRSSDRQHVDTELSMFTISDFAQALQRRRDEDVAGIKLQSIVAV